jgi:hypothetical protein
MLIRLLAITNVLLAIAAAFFVYAVLLVAIGDTVGSYHLTGPLGSAALVAESVVPTVAILLVTYWAFRIQKRHPLASLLMLLFCPLAVALRFISFGALAYR